MSGFRTFSEDAFHGSPHRFAPDPSNPLGKFSSSNIGTGEGNQAYGYGLYFAGSKDVAKWYKEKLSDAHWTYEGKRIRKVRDLNSSVTQYIRHSEPAAPYVLGFVKNARKVTATQINKAIQSIDQAIASVEQRKQSYTAPVSVRDRLIRQDEELINNYKIFREAILKVNPKKFEWVGGLMYHVEIPEDDEYLRWDVPISSQPEHIRKILSVDPYVAKKVAAINREREALNKANPERLTHPVIGKIAGKVTTPESIKGSAAYQFISSSLGSDEKASEYLLKHGISGIRYLDGTSRDLGYGNYNYVVFDDSRINIKKVEK